MTRSGWTQDVTSKPSSVHIYVITPCVVQLLFGCQVIDNGLNLCQALRSTSRCDHAKCSTSPQIDSNAVALGHGIKAVTHSMLIQPHVVDAFIRDLVLIMQVCPLDLGKWCHVATVPDTPYVIFETTLPHLFAEARHKQSGLEDSAISQDLRQRIA